MEALDANPYVAPSFAPSFAIEPAGAWTRYVPIPAPRPTPSPEPTPARLPGETLWGVMFEHPDGLVAPVGSSLRLRAQGVQGELRWGVLEPERAAIRQDGVLTFLAPGPVHVYVEQKDRRAYLLVAGRAGAPQWRVAWQQGGGGMFGVGGAKVSWLESAADWTAARGEFRPQPGRPADVFPEVLEGVDWEREAVAWIATSGSDGDGLPEVTSLEEEGLALTIPNTGQQLGNGGASPRWLAVVVPRAFVGVPVELTRFWPVDPVILPVTRPGQPLPTPPPVPTPTPDPFASSVPHAPGEAPPYPPPTMPRPGESGVCPAPAAWSGQEHLFIQYAEPRSESFDGMLPVGASVRLAVSGGEGAVRWRVRDPERARIDAAGNLTALRPGPLWVMAERGGERARALLACVGEPVPALRYRFKGELGIPSDTAPRGAVILRDAQAWEAFWERSFLRQRPQPVPSVDFSRHHVVAYVDDRVNSGDGGSPILTHVGASASQIHLVFPGFERSGGIGYRREVFLFLTGHLAPSVSVRPHHFCSED